MLRMVQVRRSVYVSKSVFFDSFFKGDFYAGDRHVVDSVTCYKCGKNLQSWKVTDDPVKEHETIYPSCAKVNFR